MKNFLLFVTFILILPTIIFAVWGINTSDASVTQFSYITGFIAVVTYTIAINMKPKMRIVR